MSKEVRRRAIDVFSSMVDEMIEKMHEREQLLCIVEDIEKEKSEEVSD